MHLHVPVISAALFVTACTVIARTPILPETFEGPLKANADTIIASTQPSSCAPLRHLDFGTTPQGCIRVAGDTAWAWVNWTGAGHVVKVGRSWMHPNSLAAFEFFRSMESELTTVLGPPIECRDVDKWTAREIRWIATQPGGISTALRVSGDPDRPNSARVVLIRALGPERCGYHVDSPWSR